jgi:uncharacterized protein (DUF1810 family)
VSLPDRFKLQRFVDAQRNVWDDVIDEVRSGCKQSHWMWFVFPQLAQLGRSPTAQFYGIASLDEARAYLDHPLLGSRLRAATEALEPWAGKRTAEQIFGPVDTLKLRSSLTLFDRAEPGTQFDNALLNFFAGARDEHTLALLQRQQ